MRRLLIVLTVAFSSAGLPLRQTDQPISELLKIHQYALATEGDPAFAVFAAAARYPATLFDLRPIRRALHQIAPEKLSASDSGLLYWADSYDAIVCYREVTPAG